MAASSVELQLKELKDMVSTLNQTIVILNTTISELNKKLANKDLEINYLKQKLYGASSEKIKHALTEDGQLSLFDFIDDVEQPAIPVEAEVIEVKAHKRERKPKKSYDDLFKDLPVEKIIINALKPEDKICAACGTEMVPIGTEVVRTEIRFTEPKLTRIEYIATTYECPKCKVEAESQFVKDDECKPALIEHSYASESLVAWTLNQKFSMAVPFYRQEKLFSDLGAPISRTTMASWAIYCYDHYFKPLTDYFHRCILKRRFIMMDETPIQVLKEEDRRPQTKSYVWAQRTGEDGLPPIIYFHYTPSRAGDNAVELLTGAPKGTYLMVDGYSGYNKVTNIKHCCCYAHIRRKFYDSIPKGKEQDLSLPAVQAVAYCDKLFSYERSYNEKGLSYKQRYNRRLKNAKPVIESFLTWLSAQHPGDNAKFNTALTYVNNRKDQLMTYLEDGRCSLSNNLTENTIRPITLGRKNWLFSDTPEGAHASMAVYTLIENAKAHNLKTYEYLKFVLEARPNERMSDDELEAISPWSDNAKKTCARTQE